MTYKTIPINLSSVPECRSVLVIYTGGTLGMIYETRDKQLVPFNFEQVIEKVPEITRLDFGIAFLSLNTPLDSSNMTPDIWVELAEIIHQNYSSYDSFVILHGTDTMAYTASALSFLLEGLNKPVLFTGAQLPIGVARSDARENFLTALEIAAARKEDGTPVVSEVCIYFNSRLLRGNRSKKQESSDFNAFHSENYPILANAGVQIEYNYPYIKPFSSPHPELLLHRDLNPNVAYLKLFPGICQEVVHSILSIKGLKGVVMETYGAGNAPTTAWFLEEIQQAIQRGVVIYNVSQCGGGRVKQGQYETSKFLKEAGVVSGADITSEAAITKMMFVMGLESRHDVILALLKRNLRGELST